MLDDKPLPVRMRDDARHRCSRQTRTETERVLQIPLDHLFSFGFDSLVDSCLDPSQNTLR